MILIIIKLGPYFVFLQRLSLLRYSPRVRNRGNRQKGRFLLPGIEIERYKNSSAVDPYNFDLDLDRETADPDPTLDPAPTLNRKKSSFFS